MPPSTTAKFVTSPTDLPFGEHWAIITGTSVTIPGDERSRTAPGHGYPEHTDRYIKYRAFTDEAEFKSELEKELRSSERWGRKEIRGIHVVGIYQPATVIKLTLTETK